MKAKEGLKFIKWLRATCKLDSRLNVSDYNRLLSLYLRSL